MITVQYVSNFVIFESSVFEDDVKRTAAKLYRYKVNRVVKSGRNKVSPLIERTPFAIALATSRTEGQATNFVLKNFAFHHYRVVQ